MGRQERAGGGGVVSPHPIKACLTLLVFSCLLVAGGCGDDLEGSVWRGQNAVGVEMQLEFLTGSECRMSLIEGGAAVKQSTVGWRLDGDQVSLDLEGGTIVFTVDGDIMTAGVGESVQTLYRQTEAITGSEGTAEAPGGSNEDAGSSEDGTGGGTPLAGATLDGGEFDLADTSGKVTVVNFFASWCPPCNEEAPELVAFAKAHADTAVVGVATNDSRDDAEGFVEKYGIDFPVVFDEGGELSETWQIQYLPTTLFLDASGREVDRLVGAATRAQLEEKLAAVQ